MSAEMERVQADIDAGFSNDDDPMVKREVYPIRILRRDPENASSST